MVVKTRGSSYTAIPLTLNDFMRFKGSAECSGYLGIKNLFKLLRNDVKAAFKEYEIYVPKPTIRSNELRFSMRPYVMHWNEWSVSNFCNLTSRDVSLINLYRKKPDLEWVGEQLEISYDVALSTLSKVIMKLQYSETLNQLQQWKNYKHLDIKSTEDFLDIHIDGLRHIFPNRVYNLLSLSGKSMREVLNKITVKELHKYRQFGRKAEEELRSILKKYQCLHLLKK